MGRQHVREGSTCRGFGRFRGFVLEMEKEQVQMYLCSWKWKGVLLVYEEGSRVWHWERLPFLARLAHGSELRERWAGWWVPESRRL